MDHRPGGEGPGLLTSASAIACADPHAAYDSGPNARCVGCGALWGSHPLDGNCPFYPWVYPVPPQDLRCTHEELVIPGVSASDSPNLASRCASCGSPEDRFGVWWDNRFDTVCGSCFAWAMQTVKTIKIQRWYP
jgi:hypothetical protein